MTGRIADWPADIEALELDVLDEEDAAGFLLARTDQRRRHTDSDAADALAVVRELGGLVLAMEQAGAYITHRRCSLADYRQQWQARREAVSGCMTGG